MSRPRNSSKPISEASDKMLSSIIGQSLASRPVSAELWDILTRSWFFRHVIDTHNDESFRGQLVELETRLGDMAKAAAASGDADFFRLVAGMIEVQQRNALVMPVDYLLMELTRWPEGAIPDGFFSAMEVFAMTQKRGIQCHDVKTVRDAAKRLGISLRRDSPGRKKRAVK
jgi:hypothetical protein